MLVAVAQRGIRSRRDGVTLVRDRFLATLERNGVERIDPAGEEFDPNVAEALRVDPVDSPDLDGKVTLVLRPGYRLGERVLRAAQVAVGPGVTPLELLDERRRIGHFVRWAARREPPRHRHGRLLRDMNVHATFTPLHARCKNIAGCWRCWKAWIMVSRFASHVISIFRW